MLTVTAVFGEGYNYLTEEVYRTGAY